MNCPVCNSENIEYFDCWFDRKNQRVLDNAICWDCDTSWQDEYAHQAQINIEKSTPPRTCQNCDIPLELDDSGYEGCPRCGGHYADGVWHTEY